MTTESTPAQSAAKTIEPWLRDILRCPACHAELVDEVVAGGPGLACTSSACGLRYRVDDGIPVLLVDEAEGRPAGQSESASSDGPAPQTTA